MKDVIILGTGGLAAQITFYIENSNPNLEEDRKINILGYIDDDDNIEKYWKKYDLKMPVLCDIDSYIPKSGESVLIGIADVAFRGKMIEILSNKNAIISSYIHPTVIMDENHKIGIGNIFLPYCIVEPFSKVGDFNIMTPYSFISHDCVVGNGNFFSKAGIAGHVKIGDNNYLGVGSTIIPHTEIGNNNIIQAGMTVDKSVKDNTTVFHRFKEKVLAIPKL